MSDNEANVEELLREGVEAARAGDMQKAREKFEAVISLDQYNEKAWLGLARVVESDEEKMTCLGNVLIINPDNERAKRMLAKLERKVAEESNVELLPGLPLGIRVPAKLRTSILFGATAVLALTCICVLFGTISIIKGSSASNPAPTAAAAMPTDTPTDTSTPTHTPTATPTPTPASTPTPSPYPPPPGPPPGHLLLASGEIANANGFLPIVATDLLGEDRRILQEEYIGRHPVFSPDGTRIVYEWGQLSGGNTKLVILNTDGTGWRQLTMDVPIIGGGTGFGSEQHPAWAPEGLRLAFDATGLDLEAGRFINRIYIFHFDNPATEESEEQIEPLTSGETWDSWPSWSPDGSRLVYVERRGERGTLDSSTDLRIRDLRYGTTIQLTTDGDEIIESAPDWSPDPGKPFILFEGASAEALPEDPRETDTYDSDIYVINVDTSEVFLLWDTDDRAMLPRWSPDARYIFFTVHSWDNRWHVLMYDTTTGATYQVPSEYRYNFAYDWRLP